MEFGSASLLSRVEREVKRFAPAGRGLKELKEIAAVFRLVAKDVDALEERVAALEKELDEAGRISG